MSRMTATAMPKAIQYTVLLRRATVVVVVVEAATGVSMTGVAIAVSIGAARGSLAFLLEMRLASKRRGARRRKDREQRRGWAALPRGSAGNRRAGTETRGAASHEQTDEAS